MNLSKLLFPALHKELAEAKEIIADRTADIEFLTKMDEVSNSTITRLQREKEALNQDRYKLQEQISEIIAERKAMTEQLDAVKESYINMINENISSVRLLQSSLAAAHRRIASLKGTITKLKKKLA